MEILIPTVGQRMYYILPISSDRKVAKYLPCVVTNIGRKRIVIQVDKSPNHRNVLSQSLVVTPPEGAWIG